MICEKCGVSNRDGARYCDSCGEPLSPGIWTRPESQGVDALVDGEKPSERVLNSPGLVGWMAADWTLRFAAAAIFGIFFGLVTVSMGEYGFSVVFFLIGGVGIVGAWYMTQAKA